MAVSEPSKEIDALRRAMSVNRMVDYGMSREQAERAHRYVTEAVSWDVCLESIADEVIARANARGTSEPEATRAWRNATAALIFAQMAFNFDTDCKRDLYRRMNGCFVEHAKTGGLAIERVQTSFREGSLFGWLCRSGGRPKAPTVIIFGGMSGWSTAYLSAAEALCDVGLACMLVDGPGQGDSRLESGLFLRADVATGLSRFVDLASEVSDGAPVGIWGNSFGGLFAALTAAADPRIAACCINGAPPRCEIPAFRTANEQLAAMFGVRDLESVGNILPALRFEAGRSPITAPVLVLEGGVDPLVSLGTQAAFREGNSHPLSKTLTWPDGEHTIYNHSGERNSAAAVWFAAALLPR